MTENLVLFQIFDFSLTEGEMKAIEALNKNTRFVELLMQVYVYMQEDISMNPCVYFHASFAVFFISQRTNKTSPSCSSLYLEMTAFLSVVSTQVE